MSEPARSAPGGEQFCGERFPSGAPSGGQIPSGALGGAPSGGQIPCGARFSEAEAKNLSPLTLAYIGDAVFELFVRETLLAEGNAPAGALHKRATKIVCAKAQSALVRRLLAGNLLSEAETEIFKRGRNAKPSAPPKNANPADYAYATGFEALAGYLYLTKSSRLSEIFSYMAPA